MHRLIRLATCSLFTVFAVFAFTGTAQAQEESTTTTEPQEVIIQDCFDPQTGQMVECPEGTPDLTGQEPAAPAAPSDELARTGQEEMATALIGAALVLCGGILLLARRRLL